MCAINTTFSRIALTLMVVVLFPGQRVEAASFTVTSTSDAVDFNPGDGVCETAAGNNVCTLRAAVQETNTLGGSDTITVPAGTYVLTIPGNNEHAAAQGDLDVTGVVTIAGAGALTTIIDGGGLDRVFEVTRTANATLSSLTLQNGVAGTNSITFFSRRAGGGISTDGDFTFRPVMTITDCIISDNRALSGGGISAGSFATTIITNTTVADNVAQESPFVGGGAGGGIISGIAASITITNTTISGNQATQGGGGITPGNFGFNLNNVTITGNVADSDANGSGDGGGIDTGFSLTGISRTLVANNTDTGGEAPDCGTTITSNGFNLIGDNSGCNFVANASDQVGSGASPIDPLLDPALADNGGSMLTHALLQDSPAINQAGTGCPATDQRGVDRVFNSPCDIGAFEAILADLQVTQTDNPDPVLLGDTLSYLITVTNAGPNDASTVQLTDTLPANVNFLSATPAQGSCSESGGVVTCALGALTSGNSLGVTVLVSPTMTGVISNSVSVSGDKVDPDSSNNTVAESTTVDPAADLSVTQTISNPVLAGSTATYTVQLTNNGPSLANGVILTDTLPVSAQFISVTPQSGSCSELGGVITCNLGSLANSASVNVTINIGTPLVGPISNVAAVSAATADSNTANNTVSLSTTVDPVTDLSVAQTATGPVTVGSTATYTVTVTNNGSSDANAVILTDTLPASTEYISAASQSGNCSETGGVVICNLGTISSNSSDTVTIDIRTTQSGLISNAAAVSASTADSDTSNNLSNLGSVVMQKNTTTGTGAFGPATGLLMLLLLRLRHFSRRPRNS